MRLDGIQTARDVLARWDFLRADLDILFAGMRNADALAARYREWLESLPVSLSAARAAVEAKAGPLEHYPLIDKTALRAAAARPTAPFVRHTSGTSGPPVSIPYTTLSYLSFLHFPIRQVLDSLKLPVPRTPVFSVTIGDSPTYADEVFIDPLEATGIRIILNVDCTEDASIERALQLIEAERPVVLATKPFVLSILSAHARTTGGLSSGLVSVVISSGAKLSATTREIAEETFGARVVNAYGMSEFGLIGVECHAGEMHLVDPGIAVETISLADESSELVLSSLNNPAFPFLRYRTGDCADVEETPCPCGQASPRLIRFDGRVVPLFKLPSGRLFSPNQLNEIMDLFALDEMQITQTECASLLVRVSMSNGCGFSDDLRTRIAYEVGARVRERLDIRVVNEPIAVDDKFQRYRSLVQTA